MNHPILEERFVKHKVVVVLDNKERMLVNCIDICDVGIICSEGDNPRIALIPWSSIHLVIDPPEEEANGANP